MPAEAEAADSSAPFNRMAIAVLALVGLFIGAYLTLYKLGIIGSLVCGSGGCETVQTSKWSVLFGVPVPFIGLAGYGGMLVLALVGLQPRFIRNRGVALLIVVGAWAALGFTVYLNGLEAFVIHAWCRWCIGSAVAAALLFIASLAELPRLRGR